MFCGEIYNFFSSDWKPKKPEDERLLEEPGEIKTTYDKGYKCETKIGEDGRAIAERHYTDHEQPWAHSNPHDHIINWIFPKKGKPNWVDPINYDINTPTPQFKTAKGSAPIKRIPFISDYDPPFESIDDFKWCMSCGGEVVFEWNGKDFCAFGKVKKTPLW